MKIEEIFNDLKTHIDKLVQNGIPISFYEMEDDLLRYFNNHQIKVELNGYKEIILQEETELELGGINRKSFSLIYPITNPNFKEYIKDGKITLIGPEIKDISESSIDFGMMIFIGGSRIIESDLDSFKQLNFISNGIEGFLIRSIPRKFWCRISAEIIEKDFSFQFLGNVIFYLYKQRFGNLIESMEIFFINSHPNIIDDFIRITSKIRDRINKRWIKKIENWKKRVDCEYDWGCEICPYQEECYDIKQVLVEREKIEK